ncbi:MAG TPA: DNA repair protein RecN [Mycobacteriales bacterium]|nr:DNA repair protein RecN [Mycobacteriales bacterium]
MLIELRLRGLGAIDEATLELGPGFTAITGETGAGKTMLLTGLGLLLGGRSDAALVRGGHDRTEVEGRFRVAPDGAVAAIVDDSGGQLDGDELVVARTISADGRSRAYVGGRSVPAAVLATLADELITVHGQSDQRGLLRPSVQRGVLDRYAGAPAAAALSAYREAFAELAAVRAELEQVSGNRRERMLEADALRHGVADIDAVEPVVGEDVALAAELARLSHAEALRAAAGAARRALHGDADAGDSGADALELVAVARRELEAVSGYDPALDALATRLAEVSYQLSDVAADVAGYLDRLEADPTRLAVVQERISQLSALTKRYGPDAAAVLAWAEQARARLGSLSDDDGLMTALGERRDAVLRRLTEAAGELSRLRGAAAARLESAVGAELAGLAMPHAAVPVALGRRDDPHGIVVDGAGVAFGPSGIDDVEFQLVAHEGAPARPLHRGASGGELSRVMLALEIVLAGADPVPTFVFDEVDAGVGGRAAVEVGRRLAALATSAQVLVVTHLPQVAAFADRHVVVAKPDRGVVTATAVTVADGETRLRELSRMLGGQEDSALARGHAEELVALADAAKAKPPAVKGSGR